jgi:SOS response regulatory protein OraA/RecX
VPSDNTGKTITKIIYGKSSIQVTIDDEVLKLDQLAIAEGYVYVGKHITAPQYDQLKLAEAFVPLNRYLQHMLSKGRYTEHQIRKKLALRKATPAQIDQLITYYKQHHLIDDVTLIKEYIEMYELKMLGYRAIEHKLKEKGFSHTLIQQTYKPNDEPEKIKRWINQFNQKFKTIPLYQKKQKITQLLLGKGFDHEVIHAHLDALTNHEEDVELSGKKLFDNLYARYEKKYTEPHLTRKLYAYFLAKGYNSRMIAQWIGGKKDAD